MKFARTFFAFVLMLGYISPSSAIELPFAKPLQQIVAPAQPKTAEATYVQGKYKVAYVELNTVVDDASAENLIAELLDADQKGSDFVVLRIDSPGGSVYAGLRIAHVLENMRAVTIGIDDTSADSMASYILESVSIRLMVPEAMILIHEPSVNEMPISGKQKAIQNYLNQMHALTEAMIEHYAKRSHLTAAQIRAAIDDTDWWLTWPEALADGLVDGVVPSTKAVIESLSKTGKIQILKQQENTCH